MDQQHLLKHTELPQPAEPEKPITDQPQQEPFSQTPDPLSLGTANQPSLRVFRSFKTKTIMNYDARHSRRLGILQLFFASVGLVLNISGIALQAVSEKYRHAWNENYWNMSYNSDYYNRDGGFYDEGNLRPYYTSSGIWGAIFFALSGSFALIGAKKKTRCVITANMVLSIFASLCALAMLGMAVWALAADADRYAKGFNYQARTQHRYRRRVSYDQDMWYDYSDYSNENVNATTEDYWWMNQREVTTNRPTTESDTTTEDYWWMNQPEVSTSGPTTEPDTTTEDYWWLRPVTPPQTTYYRNWNRRTTTSPRWWDRSKTTVGEDYNYDWNRNNDDYDRYDYGRRSQRPTTAEAIVTCYASAYASLKLASLVVSGVFVLASLTQFILSVINAYICGRVVCCLGSRGLESQPEEVSFINGRYTGHDAEQGQTQDKAGLLTDQSSSIGRLAGQGHCGIACFWNPELCSRCLQKDQPDNSTQWVFLDQNGQPVPGAVVVRMPAGCTRLANGIQIGQQDVRNPTMNQTM